MMFWRDAVDGPSSITVTGSDTGEMTYNRVALLAVLGRVTYCADLRVVGTMFEEIRTLLDRGQYVVLRPCGVKSALVVIGKNYESPDDDIVIGYDDDDNPIMGVLTLDVLSPDALFQLPMRVHENVQTMDFAPPTDPEMGDTIHPTTVSVIQAVDGSLTSNAEQIVQSDAPHSSYAYANGQAKWTSPGGDTITWTFVMEPSLEGCDEQHMDVIVNPSDDLAGISDDLELTLTPLGFRIGFVGRFRRMAVDPIELVGYEDESGGTHSEYHDTTQNWPENYSGGTAYAYGFPPSWEITPVMMVAGDLGGTGYRGTQTWNL